MERDVVEYLDVYGVSPFGRWFRSIYNGVEAAKVRTAIARLEKGNLSSVKPVGEGVSEYRIDFGPGYRVYFGQDGQTLVVLLGGGTKARGGSITKRGSAPEQRKRPDTYDCDDIIEEGLPCP